MLLQQYLRTTADAFNRLESKYAVTAKRHPKYNNLVLFKYSQIDSPFADPMVRECRGVILDESKNWEVVARPFDKFFNYGEGHAATIDWATARVQEKLDGSLVTMYYYDGQWQIATSGTPDAGGQVGDFGILFRDLFWQVWNDAGYELPHESYKDLTFMFELMTPENRVVVRHQERKLALIGVRNRVNGHEIPVEHMAGQDIPYVKDHSLTSVDAIVETFNTMDPLKQEGYVVVDANFNRIKVKHPGYVAIHHLKDGFGMRRLVEIVRSNEASEFLTYFPEWTEKYNQVKVPYDQLLAELTEAYPRILAAVPTVPPGVQMLPDRARALHRKEFAALALKTRCPAAMFTMLDGKVNSVHEFLQQIGSVHLMTILGLKNKEFSAE